jgi:hypothetical protein
MVIFGAGASYDSSPDHRPNPLGPDHPERPPLANTLFVDQPLYRPFRDEFPQFLNVIGELLPQGPKWSVEDALQRLDNEVTQNAKRKQQLTAIRYYLQGLIGSLAERWLGTVGSGATNYDGLVDQIENHRKDPEPICFVTFNYDTLLESALKKYYGVKFDAIADYVSHQQFKVFKLHGSTDWGHTLQSAPGRLSKFGADVMIEHAANITVNPNIITSRSYRTGGFPLYPAIAIPVAKKSVFECPGDHVHMLESLLPKITKVLTVGWRGTEDHFLNLLRKVGGTRLVTVAGSHDEAQATFVKIQALPLGITYHKEYVGFSPTVGNRSLDEFLAATG